MPIFVVIIVVFVLILTAYIIVHPNPMFEQYWKLYSWKGERVDDFTKAFLDNKVTFALGETRETILMIIENIEPMEFELDEISGSEVRSKTERNGLKFLLTYDLLPYEHVKLTISNQQLLAELIFVSAGEIA